MKKTIIAILSATLLLNAGSASAAIKPLNSKGNKNSCTYIKTNYKSSVMLDWSNGLAKDEELIKEIESNIKTLSNKSVSSNGKIQIQIKSWLSAEKNTKLFLVNKDIDGISSAMSLKISAINKLNKLCNTIKK
jgi:hypothetical protein